MEKKRGKEQRRIRRRDGSERERDKEKRMDVRLGGWIL
jgi:hypothetical protein